MGSVFVEITEAPLFQLQRLGEEGRESGAELKMWGMRPLFDLNNRYQCMTSSLLLHHGDN